MLVWPTIERLIAEHGAAALVTLVETRGSSPRDAGARMVVRPDGGFFGTVGGGALEWMALAEAQSLLAHLENGRLRRLDKALGPELGQCCGGRVILTVEGFDATDGEMVTAFAAAERTGVLVTIAAPDGTRLVRRRFVGHEGPQAPAYARLPDGQIIERFGSETTCLYLFGAGHVGRHLVLALAPLPFTVTWVDPRPNAFPPHVPGSTTCLAEAHPVRLLEQAPDRTFVAIMTHSHALDLDLVAAALRAGRFTYVGLIGSKTKRARFARAMSKIGIAGERIDRLVCPIGLTEITDKAPAIIAASVAAQLLIVRDSLGARTALTPSDAGQARLLGDITHA
jgi:xanthine dehydrogenase accessory factor